MLKNSKYNNHNTDFRTSIPEYSDKEIVEILKKRKHYQHEAAQLAIREAIKRGLIHSKQDLFAKEYNVDEMKFSMFPIIKEKNIKIKIIKSISRGLIICGLLPVIWGILKLNDRSIVEGGILLLLGILWIFGSARQMRAFNSGILILQFVLLASSLAYIVYLILKMKSFIIMDLFIPVVLFLLIIYGLLFLKKLHR